MSVFKVFLTESEALKFMDNRPLKGRKSYYLERDIFSGKFNLYVLD